MNDPIEGGQPTHKTLNNWSNEDELFAITSEYRLWSHNENEDSFPVNVTCQLTYSSVTWKTTMASFHVAWDGSSGWFAALHCEGLLRVDLHQESPNEEGRQNELPALNVTSPAPETSADSAKNAHRRDHGYSQAPVRQQGACCEGRTYRLESLQPWPEPPRLHTLSRLLTP
jgi:hypothetical protein